MLKHEVRLIDPETDTVVEALAQTVAAANKRCRSRLLEIDTAKAKKFAKAVAGAPEGYEMFRGGRGGVPATQLLAAWWTDAIGRKHVVMRGRRVEHDEAKRLLQKAELDQRPPLFHAYPEYVCRRTMSGVEQVVCACGCGAVGTPDSLSWMGPMCGPCFDRKEELGPEGLRANVPGVLYGDRDPLRSVACSPDGAWVAANEGGEQVNLWNIPNRTRDVMQFGRNSVFDAVITPDGRHLLVAGPGTPFAAFDLTTDPPTRVGADGTNASMSVWVRSTTDPGLALVEQPGGPDFNRLALVRVPSGELVRFADRPGNNYLFPAPGYVGKELIVAAEAVAFDSLLCHPPRRLGFSCSVMAFSHDGAQVFGSYPDTICAHDAATGRVLARSAAFDRRFGAIVLVAAPEGDFLYAGTLDGPVFVFDAETLELRAALDWHLGMVRSLAVSADGSKLFSAGCDGCVKVWPIRDLLRDG